MSTPFSIAKLRQRFMPSLVDHQEAARKFLAMYDELPPHHTEGKAIALFYCAVHLVEMVAASHNLHNRDHSRREAYVRDNHKREWLQYRPLLEASEQARYFKGGSLPMNADQIHEQLRKKRLGGLITWSNTIVPHNIGLPPQSPPSRAH